MHASLLAESKPGSSVWRGPSLRIFRIVVYGALGSVHGLGPGVEKRVRVLEIAADNVVVVIVVYVVEGLIEMGHNGYRRW